jgi:hypothetical protein
MDSSYLISNKKAYICSLASNCWALLFRAEFLTLKIDYIMAAFGEFKPILGEIARYLRIISNAQCGTATSTTITSAGTGDVPAGFDSISIIATTAPTVVTLSDGSTYTFDVVGEIIAQAASNGEKLPAYTLTSGTIKWIGTK